MEDKLTSEFFAPGLKVWLPNPYSESSDAYRMGYLPPKRSARPVYVPGKIVKRDGDNITIETEWNPKETVTVSCKDTNIHAINDKDNVDDMVEFAYLHEAALLNNVAVRYHQTPKQQIYTMAGPILIAVNPYHLVKDATGVPIYDQTYVRKYRTRLTKAQLDLLPSSKRSKAELPPHVFAVADDTLVTFLNENASQSVVISGESGAGKTEATKQIMQYLTTCTNGPVGNNPSAQGGTASAKMRLRRSGSLSMGSAGNPFQLNDGDEHKAIEAKLLRTNPVLEALGNAKTVRNDNSSRFGKFIKIIMGSSGDPSHLSGKIVGGSIQDFLLEKSRVVYQMGGERNYHVFYQMIAGASDAERSIYKLMSLKDYRYLNPKLQSDVYGNAVTKQEMTTTAGDMDDKAEYGELLKALSVVGIEEDDRKSLFCTLSGILAMGNMVVHSSQVGDSDGSVIDATGSSGKAIELASSLLGLNRDVLAAQLVIKERTAGSGGKTIKSPLDKKQAYDGIDALAKAIYGRLFKWVVQVINKSLHDTQQSIVGGEAGSPLDSANYIGILDIFGFEVFQTNSFEQFCINFANEKLQQFFTAYVFKLEMEIYKQEQIDFSGITFQDNQAIIDLIEKRPMGCMSLLDEACLFPRSTDETFLAKMIKTHSRNGNFKESGVKFGPSFIICHSAADVRYSVQDFLSKNKDRLHDNVMTLMSQSSMPLLSQLFTDNVTVSRGTFTGSNAFLGSKFKDDINKLMTTLQATTPHFVRCLKPNSLKKPDYMEPSLVLHQLRYLGVLDSIRIRHSGFSYRTLFSDFYDRFAIVAVPIDPVTFSMRPPEGADIKQLCIKLIDLLWKLAQFDESIKPKNQLVQFGVTKIFLRKQMIQSLEALREVRLQTMEQAARKIQSYYRMHLSKIEYREFHDGFVRTQAAWRAIYYRKKWVSHRDSLRKVYNIAKVWIARYRLFRQKRAALAIQAFFREKLQRLRWLRTRRSIRTLHCAVRGYIIRNHVKEMISAVLIFQRNVRKFLVRSRIYWEKVRAALLIQAAYRGHVCRLERKEVVEFLAIKRLERFKSRSIRKVQALWRAVLVQRRYIQLTEASLVLQHWTRSHGLYDKFKRIQSGTRLIQRVVRGFLARQQVRRMITANMVTDEQWRVKNMREREFLQLAKINVTPSALGKCKHLKNTQRVVSSRKSTSMGVGYQAHKIIDVDMMTDSFDVYPDGWAVTTGELEEALGSQGIRIEGIAAGVSHTICLTDEGQVYSWGWGDRGQLGHGVFEKENKPRLIEALSYEPLEGSNICLPPSYDGPPRDLAAKLVIIQIATGDEHTLALSSARQVYSWGAGGRGQLGHCDMFNRSLPSRIETLRRRVGEVSCGAYHSVALVVAGSVYTWGSGPQLGRGVYIGNGDSSVPCAVKALSKHRVRHIACGWAYTLVSTHGGDIYSWGDGRYGQLGHGDRKNKLLPTLVEALHGKVMGETLSTVSTSSEPHQGRHVRIAQVSCGARHAAALAPSGNIYTWGWNRYGQLGHGDNQDRTLPTLIKRLSSRQVKQVVCGWRHTIVLSEIYEIFAWGCVGCVKNYNKSGMLKPPHSPRSVSIIDSSDSEDEYTTFDAHQDPTLNETNIPTEVPFNINAGRVPVKLFCSYGHTLSCTGLTYLQKPVRDSMSEQPLLLAERNMEEAEKLVMNTKRLEQVDSKMMYPMQVNNLMDKHISRVASSGDLSQSVNPSQLAKMDKRQLEFLVKELVEVAKQHGALGGQPDKRLLHPNNKSIMSKKSNSSVILSPNNTGVNLSTDAASQIMPITSTKIPISSKTRGENLFSYSHRTRWHNSPILRAQEKAWVQSTSTRKPGRVMKDIKNLDNSQVEDDYTRECQVRTKLLKAQKLPGQKYPVNSAKAQHEEAMMNDNSVELVNDQWKRHSSVVVRENQFDEPKRSHIARVKAEKKRLIHQIREQEKSNWRMQREGRRKDVIGLFSNELCLAATNPEKFRSRNAASIVVKEEDPVINKNSLDLYRQEMKQEKLKILNFAAKGNTNRSKMSKSKSFAVKQTPNSKLKSSLISSKTSPSPTGNSSSGTWTGRNATQVAQVRKTIENEILGTSTSDTPATTHDASDYEYASASYLPSSSSQQPPKPKLERAPSSSKSSKLTLSLVTPNVRKIQSPPANVPHPHQHHRAVSSTAAPVARVSSTEEDVSFNSILANIKAKAAEDVKKLWEDNSLSFDTAGSRRSSDAKSGRRKPPSRSSSKRIK